MKWKFKIQKHFISLSLLLIISILLPSFVLAFSYEPNKPLAKYPEEKIFLGICAGLARKFGGNPIFYRLAFVMTFGVGLIVYLILALVMPTR